MAEIRSERQKLEKTVNLFRETAGELRRLGGLGVPGTQAMRQMAEDLERYAAICERASKALSA